MSELDLYHYDLPPELIAKEPPARRDQARLLVYHRSSGQIEHCTIRDLPEFLRPQDLLVLNDTQVLPARLVGYRAKTGGQWEGLYLKSPEQGVWEVIGQTRGRLQPGESLIVPLPETRLATTQEMDRAGELTGEFGMPSRVLGEAPSSLKLNLLEKTAEGGWLVHPEPAGTVVDLLQRFGMVPLPPYMQRQAPTDLDRERYQTLYARHPGSVAAPTAGLHFTPEILENCRKKGVQQACVTLHVGMGTFRPVTAERLEDHVMHAEWCQVTDEVAQAIRATRQMAGRVVAVGTTSVRTLESASQGGEIQPFCGETRIFIRPPYTFRSVDVLLTNFHLPKSTLLMLLASLVGREPLLDVYRQAIASRYRFFSYGDAMLVV